MGLAEVPISPAMRDDTVTNRKPKSTTKSPAARLATTLVCAPGIGLNVSKAHIMATITSEPSTTSFMGRSRSMRLVATALPPLCARMSLSPERSAARIVGMVFISVMSPGSHRAGAHRPDVAGPELGGRHVRDGHGAWVDGSRRELAEEFDRRHQHQPGQNAAGENCTGHARANDVAHAEVLRRDRGPE